MGLGLGLDLARLARVSSEVTCLGPCLLVWGSRPVWRTAPRVSLSPSAWVKPERPSTVSRVTARKAVWSLELATSLKTRLSSSWPDAKMRTRAETERT